MIERGLSLEWWSSPYIVERQDGIRVRAHVNSAIGMPTRIFAYRMRPKSPVDGTAVAEFSHICSSVDLEEFPADGPIVNSSPEWFRLEFVDVLVRSKAEALDFIDVLRQDVRTLVKTLQTMDTLVLGGLEHFGDTYSDGSH